MENLATPPYGKLISCDPVVGEYRVPPADFSPTVDDLISQMDHLGIEKAIVRHRASLDVSGYVGHDILLEEIAGSARLLPAGFITSDGREPDFDPELLVAQFLGEGIRIAWTDPTAEDFIFQSWSCRKLLTALQDRNLPLMVDFGKVNASDIHQILSDYPRLRMILVQIPRVGRNRKIEPLLELHPELYLCFSPSFSAPGYWADLCRRYGDQRWVWGSGYPEMEGGTGITGLVYSGLTPEQMQAVGYGNIERLISEVRP